MNKRIIYLLVFILLFNIVYGLNCNSNFLTIEDIPCNIVTPIIYCENYTYDLYFNNTLIVANGLLNNYTINTYYFVFNYTDYGDYYIILCDTTTRQLRVGENMINIGFNTWFIILMIFLIVLFIVLSFIWFPLFLSLSGILMIFLGYYFSVTLLFYVLLLIGLLFLFLGIFISFKT